MSQNTAADIIFTTTLRGSNARVWGTTPDVMVTGNTVRIWSDGEGFFSLCHSLTPSQTRRIIAEARAQ